MKKYEDLKLICSCDHHGDQVFFKESCGKNIIFKEWGAFGKKWTQMCKNYEGQFRHEDNPPLPSFDEMMQGIL